MDQEFDLWGDPIPPRAEKRGRPTHEVTEEKRNRIAVLRSLNWTHSRIAEAIGISEPTLRKNYFRELEMGLVQRRAEALVKLRELGMGGNVSALKAYIALTEKSDLDGPRGAVRMPKEQRLGKKDQAVVDAGRPDITTGMGELMARRAEGTGKPH